MELVCRKPVGALGRIVLPDVLRESFNMERGTIVDIYIEDQKIIIQRSEDQAPVTEEPHEELRLTA